MEEFEETCQKLGIELFVLPPASPKYNGGIERANRILREEFYENPKFLADSIVAMRYELQRMLKKYNEYRPHYALNELNHMMYINNNHETHTINNLSQLFATPEIVLDFSSERVQYHAVGWSEINANQSMYGLYEMLSKRKGNKAKNLIDDKEKRAKVLKDVTEMHKEAKDIIARLDVNVDVTLTDYERAFLGGLQYRTHEIFKYINEVAKKEEKSNL